MLLLLQLLLALLVDLSLTLLVLLLFLQIELPLLLLFELPLAQVLRRLRAFGRRHRLVLRQGLSRPRLLASLFRWGLTARRYFYWCGAFGRRQRRAFRQSLPWLRLTRLFRSRLTWRWYARRLGPLRWHGRPLRKGLARLRLLNRLLCCGLSGLCRASGGDERQRHAFHSR